MKKMIYFLLFLLIPILGFSQKKLDNAYLKCQYEHIWKSDTLENKTSDDLLILLIGENMSKCYSYYSAEVDSISALPNWFEVMKKHLDYAFSKKEINTNDYPHKRMKAYVYKNYPQGKMTVTDGLTLQYYEYEDELNAQQWEIRDSIKTILNYSCQMAVCDFRGREWTAWFTTDIPVSDGPWKLSGLPGLIMEAYDKGSQYVFTIVGLQKVDDEPIFFSETYVGSKRFEKSNRIDFLKAKKRYLMDMGSYIEMETGIDLSGGNPPKIMRYDLLELDYK
ncbi:MAG: GLPGLI family protein [Phycisphaerae bacterium]